MYDKSKAPTSADAVMITPKCVCFIEFKSGFKQRITKNNFDEEKARCKDADKVCKQYWALFFKNQKKEVQELIASIRMKALESYITLEKKILPKCCQADRKIGLKFMVIIDEDEVDNMEDTLAALAGGTQAKGNHFSEIRRALERMMVQHDADGNEYYYDDIKVWSARDFENYLRLNVENE